MKSFSILFLVLGIILLASFQNQLVYADNDDYDIFSWFQKSLEKVWESIVKINPNNEENQQIQENDIVKESQKNETPPSSTIETLTEEPVQDGTISKKFVHGDTEIIYQVGVENGVEETPPPDVLRAMEESYTKEEKEIRSKMIKELINNGYREGKVIGFNITVTDIPELKNRLQNSFKAKKITVDNEFTCNNFNELAKRYRGEPLPGFYIGKKYVGTMEGYIYHKAFMECIDPKYQEKLDKVYAELEEVNKPNENDPH